MSGPSGPVQVEFDPREGKGQFTAREHGMHEVLVTNEGEAVKVDIYNIYSIYNIYYLYISRAPPTTFAPCRTPRRITTASSRARWAPPWRCW